VSPISTNNNSENNSVYISLMIIILKCDCHVSPIKMYKGVIYLGFDLI